MNEKKITPTKNQHLVPQFYLRHFSEDKNFVSLYIKRKMKRILKSPIKSTASQDYYYDKDGRFENILGSIEAGISSSFKNAIENNSISENEAQSLKFFCLVQYFRTMSVGEMNKELWDKILLDPFKEHLKRDQKFMESIPEDLLENLKLDHKFPNSIGLNSIGDFFPLVIDLKYVMLQNETQIPFFASDTPVAFYNKYLEGRSASLGLGRKGLLIFFPICPQKTILFYDDTTYEISSQNEHLLLKNENDVFNINFLQFFNAHEILILPNDFPDYVLKK